MKASGLRLLSLDVGSKRMGLALWNPASRLASPLESLKRKTLKEDLNAVARLIAQYEIQGFVVGLPVSLGGKITESTERSMFWVTTLKENFSLPVFTVDESLSSTEAIDRLREAGAKNWRAKKDSASAVIILEEFVRESESM